VVVLILPFQLAYQPFIFSYLDKPDIKKTISRIFTYLLLAITYLSIFILIGSKMIFPIIAPPEYSQAYIVILLLLPVSMFIGVSHFGESLLNIEHKTHITGIIVAIFTFIGFILNYFFIPKFGWIGAIIAIIITRISIGVCILFFGIKSYPLKLEWDRIKIIAGLFVIFIGGIYFLRNETDLLFLLLTLPLSFFSIYLLFTSKFITHQEKTKIKNVISQNLHFRINK
jgi:O-antigen/teichoic acid export membrane protein